MNMEKESCSEESSDGQQCNDGDVKSSKPAGNVAAAAPGDVEKTPPTKKHRKPRRRKTKDMPKRPLSAYNIFFREQRQAILDAKKGGSTDNADLFSSMGKTVAKRWRELPPEQMEKYKKLADAEMQQYRREMAEYNYIVAAKKCGVLSGSLPGSAGVLGTPSGSQQSAGSATSDAACAASETSNDVRHENDNPNGGAEESLGNDAAGGNAVAATSPCTAAAHNTTEGFVRVEAESIEATLEGLPKKRRLLSDDADMKSLDRTDAALANMASGTDHGDETGLGTERSKNPPERRGQSPSKFDVATPAAASTNPASSARNPTALPPLDSVERLQSAASSSLTERLLSLAEGRGAGPADDEHLYGAALGSSLLAARASGDSRLLDNAVRARALLADQSQRSIISGMGSSPLLLQIQRQQQERRQQAQANVAQLLLEQEQQRRQQVMNLLGSGATYLDPEAHLLRLLDQQRRRADERLLSLAGWLDQRAPLGDGALSEETENENGR